MYSGANIFSKVFCEETYNFTASRGLIQNSAPHNQFSI